MNMERLDREESDHPAPLSEKNILVGRDLSQHEMNNVGEYDDECQGLW